MAVTIGTVTTDTVTTSGTSKTFSHNGDSGSNRAVIVSVSKTGATDTTCTYAGASMTQAIAATSRFQVIYYKTSAATGSNNVVLSYTSGSQRGACTAYTLTGVDEASLIGDTDSLDTTTNNPSLTLTTSSNSFVCDAMYINAAVATTGTPTVGAGQTERINTEYVSNQQHCHSNENGTGASATLSWSYTTGGGEQQVAAEIKAVAVGTSFVPYVIII